MKLNAITMKIYRRTIAPFVRRMFFRDISARTSNFGTVKWLGNPIWQNVLDLWTIQETIAEVRPSLLIECGTNRGGSSLFYAHLFDLMGKGEVVTIDIEKLHNLSHPRVTYLIGSSAAPEIVNEVKKRVKTTNGPVFVILDSDHSEAHVAKELEIYSPMVTVGSFCLVQDGITEILPDFAGGGPGPLTAIKKFLTASKQFQLDSERCERFVISHHPKGWLRRVA